MASRATILAVAVRNAEFIEPLPRLLGAQSLVAGVASGGDSAAGGVGFLDGRCCSNCPSHVSLSIVRARRRCAAR